MQTRVAAGSIQPHRIVRAVRSPDCTGSCGINVRVKDGRLLEPDIELTPQQAADRRFDIGTLLPPEPRLAFRGAGARPGMAVPAG